MFEPNDSRIPMYFKETFKSIIQRKNTEKLNFTGFRDEGSDLD